MANRLNWGILGTGNIARQFSAGVTASARGSLAAVGSRSSESATTFARTYHIPKVHGSYEALLADPDVDAIYNSLPNALHHPWTIAALRAGKHVLCEKPFAINTAQAQEMFDVAQQQGLVLVEAFMYRSHPLTLAVQKAVAEGVIGDVKLIRTSFCYRTTKIAGNVRFDPELAGGCLMDVGCYCINFSRLFAGDEPVRVQGCGHFHPSGVDDRVVASMEFANGILASFSCGMSAQADNTATINGTEGYIEIPMPWKPPAPKSLYRIARGTPPKMDGPVTAQAVSPGQTVRVPVEGELYGIEADAFIACVQDAAAPWITPADTLGNMRVLDQLNDAIRRRI
jgi:predicted dehydrogenase